MTKTTQEFIQSSFPPIIATLCSPKVDNIVSKNNLTFPELLQPFTLLDWEGQIREPGGSLCSIKHLNLVIRDVNWKPVQPIEARRELNNSVLHNYDEKIIRMKIDAHKFDIPETTPWFDAWRQTYLDVQFPSDHEFTKHFLACIIVATSLEDDIVETYNLLIEQFTQLQNVTPPKLPKWFNSSVLKSYLLLHDISAGPKDRADKMFETMKQTFGATNCFMLSINSRTSIDPKLLTGFWSNYIKQTTDYSCESLSSSSSTQIESQMSVQQGNISTPDERQNTLTVPTNVEGIHPLITTESDNYDNANSLQPYSFSGSSESVNVAGTSLERQSEVYGSALNAKDIESIKSFLYEFTAKALVPHLEKQIAQLSEVVSNKKGVSRSLLSATKRWFTTGKAGNTAINNTVIYSSDSPELQLRRLGDLWFMCGQWSRAFDAYHTAKREFYADSAWLCYAGALEMAAMSAFVAGEANRKTFAYMEESIVTYLNTCRMVQYAVRATLLSVPCLIAAGMHGEAAKQLIRMTSEDSDLRSAMLLEQAALCFLKGPSTIVMSRKYAFHMVLAGHRFSKAGQKKHAYRCYRLAYQVYAGSGWRLSTDHVQFALGRLAGSLRAKDAAKWLAGPLAPFSPQTSTMQDAFLKEFLLYHQQYVEVLEEYKEHLPVLPVPLLSIEDTAVLCVGPVPLSSPGRTPASSLFLPPQTNSIEDNPYWHKLEETLIQVAQGSVPMIFKPTIDLYTQRTDSNPIVPQGEPIQVAITLYNPLKIPVLLKELQLLWQFTPNAEDTDVFADEILNNEPLIASGQARESDVIRGQKIKSFMLEGECKKSLNLNITPLKTGQLSIQGLAFNLINVGEGRNNENGITVLGKLNLQNGANCTDKLLQITVIPQAPCLQMTLSETINEVISGEILSVDMEFRNVGPVALKKLHLAVSHPECMSVVSPDHGDDDFKVLYDEKYRPPPDFSDERAARAASRAAAASRRVSSVAAQCAAGAHVRATLLLRPHKHASELYLLAYYETGQRTRPHRLLRHVFRFKPTVGIFLLQYCRKVHYWLNKFKCCKFYKLKYGYISLKPSILCIVRNFKFVCLKICLFHQEVVEILATPRRGLSTVDSKVIENMHLSIEVKNICNEKDDNITLEVLEASLLSRQWMLTHTRNSEETDNCLITREKVHFILKSRRIFEELPEGNVKYSCLKFGDHHPESKDDINKPPYSKFVTDYMSPLLENVEISNQNSVANSGLIQSMLVLRWKAHNKNTNRTALGQHCLWMNCFSKTLSGEREKIPITNSIQLDEFDSAIDISSGKGKSDKNEIVIIKLEHSNYIDHNFKANKLCMVPVIFNIVNCQGSPVTVFIDMHKQQNRESSGELGWAGALSNGLNDDSKELGLNVTLEKFETRRVQVRALVASPGSFLVGGAFQVTTRRGRDVASHSPNTTSLLVVKQTS